MNLERAMNLPFTKEQFLSVFTSYNLAVWPMQLVLNLLALGAVFLVFHRMRHTDLAVRLTLSFLWAWTGAAYHLAFFTVINPAAWIFGALCLIQAVLLLLSGWAGRAPAFEAKRDLYGVTGTVLILYGLVLYPLLGLLLGHSYPAAPTFGLPCPTTIFTIGMLLLGRDRVPVTLLIIPFLWSLLGVQAAVHFGIVEDLGLLAAGVIGAILLPLKNRGIRLAAGAH